VEESHDPPVPVVVLKVRVAACAEAGQEIEYHLCVENCSPAPAYHVLVHNAVPKNARFVRAVPPPTRTDPELQWDLGTLEPQAKCEIVLVLAATGTDDVKNCARVQFEYGQCVITRIARTGPLPGGVPEPAKIPAVPAGEAKLSLAVNGPKEGVLNQPATFEITASNAGTAAAVNVLVTGFLPEKTKYLSASDSGRMHANQIAWLLGDLPPGASRTVKLSLQPEAAGEICVKATALADPALKASAESCTLVRGASAMLLNLRDTRDPLPVGGETSYSIVALNQGQAPITNLVIKALIPPEMSLLSAKGPVDNKLEAPTKAGQMLLYEPLANLEPGGKREYEVYVKAVRAGDVRFKIEMTADQLKTGGPVHQEESTRVYPQESPAAEPPVAVPQKRSKSVTGAS
jgi:uncharacterized repeat protein (TIGR01451 family)